MLGQNEVSPRAEQELGRVFWKGNSVIWRYGQIISSSVSKYMYFA